MRLPSITTFITTKTTLSLLALTVMAGSQPAAAQIMPKVPAVPVQQTPAPQNDTTIQSLEDLFGVQAEPQTAEPAPVVTETESNVDASIQSLNDLLNTPAPTTETVVETVEKIAPETVIVPSVTTQTITKQPEPTEMEQLQQLLGTEQPVEVQVEKTVTVEPVAPPAETVAPTVSTRSATIVETKTTEIVPVENTAAEPITVETKTTTTIQPQKQVRQTVTKAPAKAPKPAIPAMLPSEIEKLEQSLQQKAVELPSVQPLNANQRLRSQTQIPPAQPNVPAAKDSAFILNNTTGSTGSLDSLLSQQSAIVDNLPDNENSDLFLPAAPAIERTEPVAAQATPKQKDPLSDLQAAIETAKQPTPSLSKGIVTLNPVTDKTETKADVTILKAEQPETAKDLKETKKSDVRPMLLSAKDKPIKPLETKPIKLHNQPDELATPAQILKQKVAASQAETAQELKTLGNLKADKSILFNPFQTSISHRSRRDVQKLADMLKAQNGDVILVGYADWTNNGSMDATQHLSERRATALKDALIKSGIPDNRIRTVGKGLDWTGGKSKDRVDVVLR